MKDLRAWQLGIKMLSARVIVLICTFKEIHLNMGFRLYLVIRPWTTQGYRLGLIPVLTENGIRDWMLTTFILFIFKIISKSIIFFIQWNLYSAPKETNILAYQSIVRPTIEYAASIWDRFTTKTISKVERYRDQQLDLYIKTRRKAARLTILFKIRNGDLCVSAAEKHLTSTKSTHIHQARYKHLSAKTDTFKNSYFPRTIVDWNALPPVVIEATTTNQFKERLKTHLNHQ